GVLRERHRRVAAEAPAQERGGTLHLRRESGDAGPVTGQPAGLLESQCRLVGVLPPGMGDQDLDHPPRPQRLATGTAAGGRTVSRGLTGSAWGAAAASGWSSFTAAISRPPKNQK